MAIFVYSAEMVLRSQKPSIKEKNVIFLGGSIISILFWAIVFLFRNHPELNLTGDGDPFFRVLWFFIGIVQWLQSRQKYSPEVVADS